LFEIKEKGRKGGSAIPIRLEVPGLHIPISDFAVACDARKKICELIHQKNKEEGQNHEPLNNVRARFMHEYQKTKESDRIPLSVLENENASAATGIIAMGTITTWAVKEMAQNPSLLRKISEEAKKVLGSCDSSKITNALVDKLTLSNQFVKETIRLNPGGALFFSGWSVRDFVVDGYRVPKDTKLMVPIYSCNKDERIYSKPYTFDPEAHIGPKGEEYTKTTRPDFSFFGFGCGDHKKNHRCAGEMIMMRSLVLFVSRLAADYDLELDPPAIDQNLCANWTDSVDPQPREGVKIKFWEREKQENKN